ncbi:MAG: type II toxin-antitoxin system RelE family toxin [Thermoproteota archaeon]
MFKIEAKKRVLKTLRDLSRERKNRVKEAFTILSNDPLPFKRLDIVKLKGYENTYRIRTFIGAPLTSNLSPMRTHIAFEPGI